MIRDSVLLTGRANGETYVRENRTERYVCIPPAYIITDETGATWTFGHSYVRHGDGFLLSVMRNDVDTGELAEKIEFRATRMNPRGSVTIYGPYGRKVWNGRTFI